VGIQNTAHPPREGILDDIEEAHRNDAPPRGVQGDRQNRVRLGTGDGLGIVEVEGDRLQRGRVGGGGVTSNQSGSVTGAA
jgi:hypothetical protein